MIELAQTDIAQVDGAAACQEACVDACALCNAQ